MVIGATYKIIGDQVDTIIFRYLPGTYAVRSNGVRTEKCVRSGDTMDQSLILIRNFIILMPNPKQIKKERK